MENILKRNKPNREADLDLELEIEEALKNFEYKGTYNNNDRDDLSEYSVSATPRRDLNHSVSDSLNFSFNELRRAHQEVDQYRFQPMESEIQKMKRANRGEFLDYDYEQMEEKPFMLHNELIPENKVEEIRQIITTQAPEINEKVHLGSSAFNNIKANNFMFDEEPEIVVDEDALKPQLPEKSERDEEDLRIAKRMEKAQRDQEIWRMEKEDARSMKYERFLQQEKFKNRLFNLPESFPIYKETVLRSTNLSSNINPREAKFALPTIMRPIANPKENLIETSKTQIEKMALNKITNKLTKRLNYRKITEKDKLLLSKNTFNPSKSRVLDDKENSRTLASLQNTKNSPKEEYYPSELLIKISSNTSNLATWVLDKSSHLNLKFAKMEISKVKIDLGNDKAGLPKTLFTQSKAPVFDSELEMEMELESAHADQKDAIKSLDYFISQINEKKGIQNLELKMENLKDVNGIQQLPDLQNLVLSMNKIQEIKGLNTLKYLTDIDLSQNNIKSMRGLSNLSYLRNLNLEVNSITKIEDLEGCQSLEVLNLSNNQITQFEGLSELKKLKKLLLFRNKITNTDKIEQLTYLEELDLGRNNIKDISFIQKLPVLRKLVVYFNQIDKLPLNLSHITLSEMWLNGNKLEDISNLAYFPSLKLLNLQENDIKILSKDSFVFIPNLKLLNLSFNKIESFGEIYRLLNSFPSIQHIDLNENPFIRSITETLSSFYEDILLTLLPNLGEINSKVIPFSQRNRTKALTDRETWRTLPLNSNRLEDDMYHVDRFTSSKVNNRYKSFFFTQKSQALAKAKMGPYYLSQISTIPKEDLYVLNHEYSCGIHHSNLKLKTSLHKIRSMLVKYICKKRTYKRYMQKNLAKIIQIQAFYKGYCLRKIFDVRKRLQEKRRQKLFNSKGRFALRIQKVYRGYLIRRRKKDLFRGIKYDDDEFDEFKDADMSFLNKGPDLDAFTLKLPGNLDLNQFIPTLHPQNLMQMNNPVLRPIENKKSPPAVSFQDEDEEKQDNDDAFSVSSANTSKSIQTIRLKQNKPPVPKGLNKEQKAELINDWGFKEENSQAFEFWAKKKLRPKEKAKPLDAEARLQKFYRNAQK